MICITNVIHIRLLPDTKWRREGPMASLRTASAKVPLSLRLPESIVTKVEEFARQNRISKTEAFQRFIEKGIAADESSVARELESIHAEIARLRRAVGMRARSHEDELLLVMKAVGDAAAKHPAIKRAYLFGSFARGDFDDLSDIDVRIERDPEIRFNLRDLDRFAQRIERATGREVDVVSAADIADESLAIEIEQEKVIVYECQA